MSTDRTGQYVGAYGWVENLKPIPASFVTPVPALPGRRARSAADGGKRQRLHSRAVDDARRDCGAASQRAPWPHGCSRCRMDRSRSSSPRDACAKPLGCSKACDRVNRSARCSATAWSACSTTPWSTTAAAWTASSRRCVALRRSSHARAGPTTAPVEAIAANNVVDGLVLNRRWKEERTAVARGAERRPSWARAIFRRSASIFDKLADAIDGLSDALTAESAYQMVRGNTSRTASTLSAIAQGDAPPPELEVATHAAIGHLAHASPAAADERAEHEHRRVVGRGRRQCARARRRCSTSGRSSCSATAPRFAARSNASTT